MRTLKRFFRHSDFLISRLALDWEQNKGIVDRWKTIYYRSNLLELPQKLLTWAGKIDHRAFPDNSPEQVQALVTSLHALAHRINALAAMRDLAQADLLVKRIEKEVGGRSQDQVSRAFELALLREPSKEELTDAVDLVNSHGLVALCRAIYNSNEFLFLQ